MFNITDALTAAQRCANLQACDYVVMHDAADGFTVVPAITLDAYLDANPTETFTAVMSPR